MKRKIVLPAVAVLSVLALVAAFLFRPLPTTITSANAARISPGMPLAAVVAILGDPRDEVSLNQPSPPPPMYTIPAADFMTLTSTTGWQAAGLKPVTRTTWRRRWVGEHCTVHVDFVDDQVTAVEVPPTGPFDSASAYLLWRGRRALGQDPVRPLDRELFRVDVVEVGDRNEKKWP